MNEATLDANQLNLLALALPHFSAIGSEECEHYLRKTGPTFGDWLKAREELFKFQTGLVINLRDMFAVDDQLLAKPDIMPIFRPVGATNRTAVRWMTEAGLPAPYEEVDVMGYSNSGGPKVPELYYIRRSVRPDEDTFGDKAKSADELVALSEVWCGLYGYADASVLHFLITRKLLDPETVTSFPKDRLPVGKVARGDSDGVKVRFYWNYAGNRHPSMGARAATPVPFKT